MRQIKIKISAIAAIFAGMFLLTACPVPDLSLSPSSLTFEAIAQGEQSVSIKSNASDWKIQSVSDNWITATKNSDDDKLYVSVQDYYDTNNSRTGTITIKVDRRGKSASEEIAVEQRKISPPQESNYTVSCTPLTDNPPFNLTGWTGRMYPFLTDNPPYYAFTNWATDTEVNFYFDFVNGQFILDTYTKLFDDGIYDCFMTWGTFSNSTGFNFYHNERIISYNWSTRTFETGTYEGLPVFLTITRKNRSTGRWDDDTYYANIFSNFRLTLASTYAPQPESSHVGSGLVKKQLPSNVKVTVYEDDGLNHSPRNYNKK